jgi:hypothetical protein
MRPEEIGDLLATDPESVIVARDAALEQLASGLGADEELDFDDLRGRLATLPGDAWTPPVDEKESAPERPPLTIVDVPEPELKPQQPARAKEQKSRLPLLLALLAVAAVVLVVVLASGGSDESTEPSAPAPQASEPAEPAKPSPAPAAREVKFSPLGTASGAAGTAALLEGGKRLQIDVTGLRAGSYGVWLYDSVIDANLIGKGKGKELTLDLKLPADASNYRYVDISRERPDGNPNHSGESVLRVPLAKLTR